MLAVIHLVPVLIYGAAMVGGALATWLTTREPKKEDEKKDEKKKSKKPEMTEDILSRDLMSSNKSEKSDGYKGDDRFELLDL